MCVVVCMYISVVCLSLNVSNNLYLGLDLGGEHS